MTESFSKNFIDYEEYPQSGKCAYILIPKTDIHGLEI